MSVKYDTYYAEGADALGPPTARLVKLLQGELRAPSDVLDVGCGQGRDAVWLAKAGHHVVGFDVSTVGIGQLKDLITQLDLSITAEVADLESFQTDLQFDCLLFDRTLHMVTTDVRIAGFKRLLGYLKPAGLVVVLDEAPNLDGLRAAIPQGWAQIWGGKSDFAYRRPDVD